MLNYIKRNFKRSSIFARQLTLFIALILLCVFLLGVGNTILFSRLMLAETKKSHADMLRQARSEIDQRYADIKGIAYQISMQTDMRKAMYYNEEITPARMESYKRVQDYILGVSVSYSYIDDIWIYFKRAGTVVNTMGKSDLGLFFSVSKNYRSVAPYMGYIENGAVFDTISVQRESGTDIISFAAGVPFNNPNNEYVIIIDVNQSLFSQMITFDAYNNPTYILLGATDTVIAGNNTGKDLDAYVASNAQELLKIKSGELSVTAGGRGYTLIVEQSPATGYSYIAAIPQSYVSDKLRPIQQNSYLLMACSLLIGALFAYTITRALYNPIRSIVDYIKVIGTPVSARDEIAFIDRFIQLVYEQNEALKKDIVASRHMIRERLLKDALTGAEQDGDIARDERYLSFPHDGFNVIALQMTGGHSDSVIAKVRERLSGYKEFPEIIRHFVADKDGIIICLINASLDDRQAERVYDLANGLARLISDELAPGATVGIGRFYTEASMISRSYAEALSALKHKSIKGENAIIHIDEVAQNQPENYVYTLETETRLLNFIKTGDAQAAISLIDDIIGSAAEGNFSSADMDNTFVLLASTILRAAYDTGCAEPVRDVFTSLHRSSGAGPMAECIHAHVAALINAINEKRTGQNRHIFDQMILYIEEHYAQDISLNILKDQVGYSGSYLSHIFKQVSGENFVDYLNRYRILRAKELLAKTRLSIAQISQQCGFTTSNNFIRVYKKYEGVTPGQFRRNSGG